MGYEQGPGGAGDGRTAFRNAEKRYKLYTEKNPKSGRGGKGSRQAKQEVDLSDVIDLSRIQNDREYAEQRGAERLESACDWPTYILQSHPGLYLIPSALSVSEQQYWVQQALQVFPDPPNRTNHDAEYGPIEGLWAAAQAEQLSPCHMNGARSGKAKRSAGFGRGMTDAHSFVESGVESIACARDCEGNERCFTDSKAGCPSSGPRHSIAKADFPEEESVSPSIREQSAGTLKDASSETVSASRAEPSDVITDPASRRRPSAAKLLRKLRWATLGLQYDWSTRSYNESLPHAPFPADLAGLAARLAAPAMQSSTGLPLSPPACELSKLPYLECSEGGYREENVLRSRGEGDDRGLEGREPKPANGRADRRGAGFRAEGAIVNYYGPADALSAHLDDVEENMDLPIVSISLGCKAVFLIGGETRDISPTAIYLRSGDGVLMAGPARRCYHGGKVTPVIKVGVKSYTTRDKE